MTQTAPIMTVLLEKPSRERQIFKSNEEYSKPKWDQYGVVNIKIEEKNEADWYEKSPDGERELGRRELYD